MIDQHVTSTGQKKIWVPDVRNWTYDLPLIAPGLAQSVERLTAEREVAGSIPGARPILMVLR